MSLKSVHGIPKVRKLGLENATTDMETGPEMSDPDGDDGREQASMTDTVDMENGPAKVPQETNSLASTIPTDGHTATETIHRIPTITGIANGPTTGTTSPATAPDTNPHTMETHAQARDVSKTSQSGKSSSKTSKQPT